MTDFTAYEQLLLELMNRARLDPLAEAQRLNIDLNEGLAPGTISSSTKQALAGNNNLVTAARAHSQFMIDTDQFDHAGIGDGTPSSRMVAAGYALTGGWSTGENIAYTGTTGPINILTETYNIADNLFLSHGHRENTLADFFREAGTGTVTGVFTVTDPVFGTFDFNAVMATENFGTTGSSSFVTGVTINDTNGNNFYDVGEARSGVSVQVTTAGSATVNDISETAGGYSAAVSAGPHTVTFSGGGLAAPVSVVVTSGNSGSDNAKVDLSGTNKILSSVTATLGSGAKDLVLLGAVVADGTGNALDNIMTGSRGANTLSGGTGNDTLVMSASQLTGSVDVFNGGADSDTADFSKFASAVTVNLGLAGIEAGTYDQPNLTSGTYRDIADLNDIENVTGSAFADYLSGNGASNTLNGGNGADHLWGGAGADSHIGGDDTGIDYARYDDANWGNLTIRLDNSTLNAGAAAVGDTYNGIEGLVGGAGNDTVSGNASANYLFGQGGTDLIYGQAGADYLNGGAGGDHLWGGAGADSHVGGDDAGIDYARYDDANYGNLTIRLDNSTLNAGAAAVGDTYFGIEGLVGGAGNDIVVGNASANYLFGGGGDDFIFGATGNDYLNGGAGSDKFVFNTALNASTNADTIADFTAGVDDIWLSTAIFSAIGPTLSADEFRAGTAAVDSNDYLIYNSANGRLYYDQDGSGTASTAILFATITAGTGLGIGDFVIA